MQLSRRALFSLPKAQPPAADDHGHWLHLGRAAMACRFEITVPSELQECTGAAHDALDGIDALEAQLSIFRASSELSAINREAAAGPVPVEARLFELLSQCAALHRETEGAFDITSTPLSQVWGFLRREGRVPTADELGEAQARVGMEHVQLDEAARTVAFARPGMALNLGSIGKGYALDRVAAEFNRKGLGTALLTAGASSVLAHGAGPDGRGYLVGLRDPFDHGQRLGTVRLRDAALGVSGAGEQSFASDGKRYGHILDPRTGWPVEGRVYVAVVAPTAALADALATAFFVGGRALAERHVKNNADVSAVIVDAPLSGQRQQPVVLGRPSLWSFNRAQ
jgi:thiamine biosynthesis lipoprotein